MGSEIWRYCLVRYSRLYLSIRYFKPRPGGLTTAGTTTTTQAYLTRHEAITIRRVEDWDKAILSADAVDNLHYLLRLFPVHVISGDIGEVLHLELQSSRLSI